MALTPWTTDKNHEKDQKCIFAHIYWIFWSWESIHCWKWVYWKKPILQSLEKKYFFLRNEPNFFWKMPLKMSFWLQKSIHIFPKLLPNSTQLIIFFLIELVLETPLALTATRTQLNVKCCPCHKAIEKFLHKFSTLLVPSGSKMGNYMSYNRLLSFFEKKIIS